MPNIKNVLKEEKIWEILEKTKKPSKKKVFDILKKASHKKGLSLEEIGFLLNVDDLDLIDKMLQTSSKIKNEIYGERLVFFAPLYLSSFCINDCEYCAFHKRNSAVRKKLTLEEVVEQVNILINMGHKRLLLEFGEHPKINSIDYVADVIRTIYETKSGKGEIRRVNVNIAATSIEDYKKLKEAGIGTYQLFQETYHYDTYKKLHHGPKADYERQLFAHDRAIEAGLDDVGLGVLYGLFDYKFDTLALVSHSQYLDKKYGIGPHTISVPRLQPAPSVDFNFVHKIDEKQLLKIISILRMAVPYTGIIISTRESAETRAKAFEIGVSQASAGSKTDPGGYGKNESLQQFSLQDHRGVDEVVLSALEQGLMPSFCTACYRSKRTGKRIMKLLKSGNIHALCRPNAILTLKEYLVDYASSEIKEKGEEIIKEYLGKISNPKTKKEVLLRIEKIKTGDRDLFF